MGRGSVYTWVTGRGVSVALRRALCGRANGPGSPPFQPLSQAPRPATAAALSPASVPGSRGPRIRAGVRRLQAPGPLGPLAAGAGTDRGPGSARARRLTCLGARRPSGRADPSDRAEILAGRGWGGRPGEAAPEGAPWRRDAVPRPPARAARTPEHAPEPRGRTPGASLLMRAL